MPQLALPSVEVRASFFEALAEFRTEGRDRPEHRGSLRDGEAFEAYVARLLADALEETPRADGWVPATTLWYVEGATYIGRISIRHRLTPSLREVGGHIGYEVRPSQRRRGHATAMLREALPIAASLGIASALVTCDDDNIGSRKVIEANGGVLEDCRGGKLRFWVRTTTARR